MNLFAYTGGSTLAAAAAGAEVTHVDAAAQRRRLGSPQCGTLGASRCAGPLDRRGRADFVRRELKRGRQYQRVVLDPPSYGHGPKGQVWKLEHERFIHERFGVNSALFLPLLRERECIGVLAFLGSRPNIFGATDIARAESFRDQALIAMGNPRLFNETQEALEQQTATSEVLRVISSSPGDLEPVFRTMLENSTPNLSGAIRRPVVARRRRFASGRHAQSAAGVRRVAAA